MAHEKNILEIVGAVQPSLIMMLDPDIGAYCSADRVKNLHWITLESIISGIS